MICIDHKTFISVTVLLLKTIGSIVVLFSFFFLCFTIIIIIIIYCSVVLVHKKNHFSLFLDLSIRFFPVAGKLEAEMPGRSIGRSCG